MSRIDLVSNVAERASVTIESAVSELAAMLDSSFFDSPSRIAADVVAALLEVPRSWLSLNRSASVDAATMKAASLAMTKLIQGAPFAYAVGSAAFRHLNLLVDERVLIPRPETEVLVGEILERFEKEFGGRSWGTAIDIGTGSGAIALSLAAEGKFDRIVATDASKDALDVASINCERSSAALRAPVEFRHGSLLAPVKGVEATLIVSNPPYIAFSEAESLPASVRDWEPPLALICGGDGLAATAGIVRESGRNLVSGGLLALEVDERRASLVAKMIMRHGGYRDVGVRLDLAGRERFVLAWRI
jgi:release factor glutamine methyltransferase